MKQRTQKSTQKKRVRFRKKVEVSPYNSGAYVTFLKKSRRLKGGAKKSMKDLEKKLDEERKKTIEGMIVGNKNEHRIPINHAIDGLFKQAGHSQVGPPHFMKPQPWMTKYNQVKGTMTMIGKKLNDPALKPGGQLHVRLQDIKKDHETKLKEDNKRVKEIEREFSRLTVVPSNKPKKTKMRGGSTKRRRYRKKKSYDINRSGSEMSVFFNGMMK
jgi:hypothetical protein